MRQDLAGKDLVMTEMVDGSNQQSMIYFFFQKGLISSVKIAQSRSEVPEGQILIKLPRLRHQYIG